MATEEATAVNDQVVTDATATDSSSVGTEESAATEATKSYIQSDSGEIVETETDGDDSAVADESTEETGGQSQGDKTADPKDEWNSLAGSSQDRFRQTVNERNELRRRLEELEAKKAQFATEQDLLNEINPETGDYYTPQEIERISWQKGREAQAQRVNEELYQTQVLQNQRAIDDEAMRVSDDFPLVDPRSKDYVPEIGVQYAEALNDSLIYALPDGRQANRSTLLAYGVNPDTQATLVGYTSSPYKLAKLAADSFNRARVQGETLGQAKAQKATETMLANADSAGSSMHGDSKFENLSVEQMASRLRAKGHDI